MNILGVGVPELILVLIIMLVVAGPKRMILWANRLGYYVGRFRVMWSQTVDLIQQEFDEAGVDIQLPKEPPSRQNITDMVKQATKPVSDPFQQAVGEVEKELASVKEVAGEVRGEARNINRDLNQSAKAMGSAAPAAGLNLGTWSKTDEPAAAAPSDATPADTVEPSSTNFGTWSKSSQNKE